MTRAAVEGATSPLMDRIENISKRLGVTADAAKTLLRIAGEQADVSDDRLAQTLTKIANDYKRLQSEVAALNIDNPIAQKLVEHARPEIDAGHFDRADDLLRQAVQAQLAAATEARKLADKAAEAADAQMLGAANATAAQGDMVLTQRRYAQAAELFAQAAAYVPSTKPEERRRYIERQAEALYRLGDEKGKNDALRDAILLYVRLSSEVPPESVQFNWVYNAGNAVRTLGERDSGTAFFIML